MIPHGVADKKCKLAANHSVLYDGSNSWTKRKQVQRFDNLSQNDSLSWLSLMNKNAQITLQSLSETEVISFFIYFQG